MVLLAWINKSTMKEKTAVNFTPQPRLQLHFRQGNLQGLPVALFVQNSVGQFSGNNLEMAGRENDGEQKRRECGVKKTGLRWQHRVRGSSRRRSWLGFVKLEHVKLYEQTNALFSRGACTVQTDQPRGGYFYTFNYHY